MTQNWNNSPNKRSFPSKREIGQLSDDEIGKAIREANDRSRFLQSQAAAFQRYESRCNRELKRRTRAKVKPMEVAE